VPARTPTLKVRFDIFDLDEADARLRRDGAPVPLAPKAFAVLCTLVRQPGVLITKNDLLDAVWGHQHVSESVLKTIISELRAALADDARQPRYIETAARRGYRFIGRPDVVVNTVVATSTSPAVRPIKSPSSSFPAPQLIGREAPLARIREAWRRAQAGERQLVWIAGEAGVGKTRLIQSFLSELEPGTSIHGQCVEHFGSGEPYLPLLEAVKELCRNEPEFLPVMRAVAPTWLVQMPWLVNEAERASLALEVAGAHQDRMVREMRELMDRFTANRPLVFVLEDMHWVDQGTLRMMEHFARRPREVRLLWLATFRLTQVIAEDHPLRQLRQELRLHRLCDEILLEPFSESEVAAYMEDRLSGTRIPEDFARRLHAHTDGLPLFIANVADTLISQTAGDATAMDRWLAAASAAPLPVPDSLAGVIETQFERLPADVQSMLQAASVCGVEFRAGIVAEMMQRDADWVTERCDDLVKRQYWLRHAELVELPDGGIDMRYSFLHALYQHVFYQRLSVTQRVQLHRRAAKAMEAIAPSAAAATATELASHHERGHQIPQALQYYARAAELALAHFAARDTLNITEHALKLLDRIPEGIARMEAELPLVHKRAVASGQVLGIGSELTVTMFKRARALCEALPDTPERALLLNGLGLTLYVAGQYKQSRQLSERSLASGDRFNDPMLRMTSLLLLAMIDTLEGDHELSVARQEEALVLCEELGEKLAFTQFFVDPVVALRTNISVPLSYLCRHDEARKHLDAAFARSRQQGQPTSNMLTLWVEGMFQLKQENVAQVAEIARELAAVVERDMMTQGAGPASWLRGWAEMHQGSPAAAVELIRNGYQAHARLHMYAGNTEPMGHAAEALLLAGDLDGADKQLDAAFGLAQRIGEIQEVPRFLLLRGQVALARGDGAAARTCFEQALQETRTHKCPFYEQKALAALAG
jgi:DNA-binding winged helix-turn-helix (wHTH) protein/tetratricopeptide (TPR) repeat protein